MCYIYFSVFIGYFIIIFVSLEIIFVYKYIVDFWERCYEYIMDKELFF